MRRYSGIAYIAREKWYRLESRALETLPLYTLCNLPNDHTSYVLESAGGYFSGAARGDKLQWQGRNDFITVEEW